MHVTYTDARLSDWVRGPEMDAAEAAEFAAYTRELTAAFWPMLGVLIAACAALWRPVDWIVFVDEPLAIQALGDFRGRVFVVDLLLSAALPRLPAAWKYAHILAFLAASVNLALSGWCLAAAGSGSARWLYFLFFAPVFSVLLPVPLAQRTAATILFVVAGGGAWLAHPASSLTEPGVLAGFSFMAFLVGLNIFIGHLLFVLVQRSFSLRRRLDAQRQELVMLTDHLEERVDQQTAELRALGERAHRARAEQRREIASELHDGLGQELTSLRLLVALRARLQPSNAAEALAEVDGHITQLQSSMRRILESLRPEPLADGSLPDALAHLCGEMERRSGLRCAFEARHAAFPLSPAISLGLFRVAQEGLTNAVRHARATSLTVCLEGQRDRLVLRVEDDGVGFDPLTARQGHGTRNIRERAAQLGGEVTWTFDRGTRLEVSIPRERAP